MRKRDADPKRLQLENYTIKLELLTQFSDMDALRHLNNVAVARFYESARSRFFLEVFDQKIWPLELEEGVLLGMVEANISYFKEGFYPDPVSIGTSVARVGKSSYGLVQGLFQNGECIGLCDSVFVFTKDHRSHPIPAIAKKILTEKLQSSSF